MLAVSLTSDIVAYLKTQSTVTDVVGTGANARIRPEVLHQSETLPAIVINDTDGFSFKNLSGASGFAMTRIQLDAVAVTKAAAESLREILRLVTINKRGTVGSFSISEFSDPQRTGRYEPSLEGKALGRYRAIITYSVYHSEATP